ncbi:hypothetical protein [Puia sp.]|jgi:SAM-dependent methyltransferase|uniref:class I SAM-dependent methyltransferase n=1 Tax=Puia sp. TaxID=2045100 RepID=UPI002F3F7F64
MATFINLDLQMVDIAAIGADASLFDEKNFADRAQALDGLEDYLMAGDDGPLGRKAADLRRALEDVDAALFQKLRERIRNGECRGKAFREMVAEYVKIDYEESGYDHLDLFINRLLSVQEMPMPTLELEPEMVEFYKTPARIVFGWIDRIGFPADAVFYDVGAGLGQVVLLVHLLTGIRARGVEIEPAYCDYARDCAGGLGLQDVDFICADARNADLSDGTIFFLYTPFRGAMLKSVLDRLKALSESKSIEVLTYGPMASLGN